MIADFYSNMGLLEVDTYDIIKFEMGDEIGADLGAFLQSLLNGMAPNLGRGPKVRCPS